MPCESFYIKHIRHYLNIGKPVPVVLYKRLAQVRALKEMCDV